MLVYQDELVRVEQESMSMPVSLSPVNMRGGVMKGAWGAHG